MDTLLVMLKNVMIFVLLAVPGYLLVRGKLLTGKDSGLLSKLLTYVGMPALILSNTLNLEFTAEVTVSLIITAILGTAFLLATFFLSSLLVKDSESKKRGMLRFCMVFANNGFIGIPLAKAVFPDNAALMTHLIVLNIVMNLTMFTLGTYLVSGDKKSMNVKKALLTPVLLAFVAGIALNLVGVAKHVADVKTYVNYFSGIVTPLSMLVLGIKLAEVPMKKLFTSGRMYYVSTVRLVLFPVLCVALMLALQYVPFLGVNRDMILGFFIAFSMPTAGLASAFADQHKGDAENAVICTLGTTVLSCATIPVLYWLLCMII